MRTILPPLLLLALSIVVRLPWFFPAVIDHDESTFILIGQSWLDGYLPYTRVWDVKPPLLFGMFAGILGVVGDSVPGIRMAGAVCVAVTAWILYVTVRRTWSGAAAAFSATVCVVLSTVMASGQATMSEHLMLPWLVGAVSLWLRPHRSTAVLFAIGGLLAAAVFVRPNAAFTLLVVAGCLALERSGRPRVPTLLAFAAGGVSVAALVCAPFVLAGHFSDLWTAAIVGGGVRAGLAAVPTTHVWELLHIAVTTQDSSPFWLAILLWGVAATSVIRGVARRESLILASVVLGVAISGGTYQHYFIQLVPFAALLAAPHVEWMSPRGRVLLWGMAAVAAFVALQPVGREYRALASRLAAGESPSYGPAYDIAAYLTRENPEGRPVVLFTDHLAYWLVGAVPPSRFAAHPSTLGRPQLLAVMGTSPQQELEAMFDQAPVFVVMDADEVVMDEVAHSQLRAILARDYVPQPSVAGRLIYRRLPGTAVSSR